MTYLFNSEKKAFSFSYPSMLFLLGLIILSVCKTNAQITDSLGKRNTSALTNTMTSPDTITPKMENGMKVTYEHGVKLVGEKSFTVAISEKNCV